MRNTEKTSTVKWEVVDENATSGLTGRIKNGLMAAFRPAGSFDARMVIHSGNRGRGKLYVRYVGEESA